MNTWRIDDTLLLYCVYSLLTYSYFAFILSHTYYYTYMTA